MTCATRSYCDAKSVIAKMVARTVQVRKLLPAPKHLEPASAGRPAFEQEEQFHLPEYVIVHSGFTQNGRMRATGKVRPR